MGSILEESRTVLEGFFSAPIAKAITGAATKRANAAGQEGDSNWSAALFAELTRLLAVYLPDPARRGDCMARLEVLGQSVISTRFGGNAALRPPPVPRLDSFGMGEVRKAEPRRASSPSGERPRAPKVGTTSVVVRDEVDIPNACEVAKDLARKLGFSLVDQTKMATAVSELARNMLQYAGGGNIRFAEVLAPRRGLEAFFEDNGPGIADLEGVLDPKYRSTTGMGMGLRGSKRIADEFLIDTQPGDGTRITMRKYVA